MRYIVFIFSIIFIVSACGNKDDIDKLRFLEKGNLAYADKDFPRAVNYYNEALMKDSTFVDAWNNKGLAFMKHAEYDEAINCFNKAIQFKPDYGEAMLNNARANLAVHQYFAAAEWVDQLKKVWPDTSLVHFTEGLILAGKGDNKSAMQAFKRAKALDSSNAEILVNLANLFYHQQQPDSAITYLKQAIALDATLSNAYNILAMVYVDLTNYEEALAAINTAIKLNSKDPFYLNNKGFILFKLSRFSEAEESVIQSMKMDPYNAWTYRNLGLLRHAEGKYADAIRFLEKAKAMDDKIDDITIDLAKAYLDNGEKDKACEILLKNVDTAEINAMYKATCR